MQAKRKEIEGKGGKAWNPAGGKGGPNTECYNCGEKGHIAINCPKKGKGKGNEGKGGDGKARPRSLPPVFYGDCGFCGKPGHHEIRVERTSTS